MIKKRIDDFLAAQTEIDQLKNIFRKSAVPGRKHPETDPEHCWHCAMWFLTISDLFTGVNVLKVIVMLIIHDLGELITGDILAYEKTENDEREELKMARGLFSRIFTKELAMKYYNLFIEFHKGKTREARIACSFDQLQPMLQNINTEGKFWKKKGITLRMLDERKRKHMTHDKIIFALYEELLYRASRFIS